MITKLTLPFPISMNAMYIPLGRGKRRKILTSEARAYKTGCAFLVREQVKSPLAGPEETLAMLLVLYPARYNIDADNHLKIMQDTLKMAGVVKDDRVITPTTAVISSKSATPFCEVYLSPLPKDRLATANKVIRVFESLVDEGVS